MARGSGRMRAWATARAVARVAVAAAHPERVREHQQQERERDPVQPKPEHRRQEVPVPVHVRIDDIGRRGIEVEPVFEAEIGQLENGPGTPSSTRKCPTYLLLTSVCTASASTAIQEKARQLQHEKLEQVMAELDPGESLASCTPMLQTSTTTHQQRLQHEHGQQLGEKRQPRRRRCAVGQLVHARARSRQTSSPV